MKKPSSANEEGFLFVDYTCIFFVQNRKIYSNKTKVEKKWERKSRMIF